MSFTFEDLNDELFEKVIAFYYSMGTGMGGPGNIFLLTRDGKRYQIGQDGFEGDWIRPATYFPFMAESTDENGKWYRLKWGDIDTFYCLKELKEPLLNAIQQNSERKEQKFLWWWDFVWLALGRKPEDEERILYDRTREIREKEEEERKRAEEHFEAVRLKPDEYEWRKLYSNNFIPKVESDDERSFEGWYLLLFKKNEDERIDGAMMTIEFQREHYDVSGYKSDARVEAYNLFYHRFEDVRGPLEISPFRDGTIMEELELDFQGRLGYTSVNIRDRFIRSYTSLDKAKSDAMFWLQVWGRIDRENVIPYGALRDDEEKMKKREQREAELVILFTERYSEIIEIIKKYDFPGNAIHEVAEALEISKDEVRFIYRMFTPALFTTTRLQTVKKMLGGEE